MYIHTNSSLELLHQDLKRRWLDVMPSHQRDLLDIATLLDPRFKEFEFYLQHPDLDEASARAMATLKGV